MSIKYFKIPVKESFKFTLSGRATPTWGGRKVVQFLGYINDDYSQEYGLQPLQGIHDHLWDKSVGDSFVITRLTKGRYNKEARFDVKSL